MAFEKSLWMFVAGILNYFWPLYIVKTLYESLESIEI